MSPATSPEELEILLEDALLLGDATAVAGLLEEHAVLVTEEGALVGRSDVPEVMLRGRFVACLRSVTVVRDVAIVVGTDTVNVSSRGPDRQWRLIAIVASGVRSPGHGGGTRRAQPT